MAGHLREEDMAAAPDPGSGPLTVEEALGWVLIFLIAQLGVWAAVSIVAVLMG